MKKTAFFLFLTFLFACKKEKEPDPQPVAKTCYPKTVTRTVSFSTDVVTTHYSYDAANRIEKEEQFTNNALTRTGLYHYNAGGYLDQKNYYFGGRLYEQNDISLDAAGRPVRLSHSYVDNAGVPTLHHYRTFEYTPDGKIAAILDHNPPGPVFGGIAYEHFSESRIKTITLGQNSDTVSINDVAFDSQNHPFSATVNHNYGLLHNELTRTEKDRAGKVINLVTNEMEYNAQGYPVKITQTHTSGVVVTETFSY